MSDRVIKFRAWDKTRNEMEYFTNPKNGLLYQDGEMFVSSGWDGESNPTFDEVETERFVLMQYTGLEDKNGVKIYEGDIIQFLNPAGTQWTIPFEIGFRDGCFGLANLGGKSLIQAIKDYSFEPVGKNLEVIGNIHENPELLK